MEYEKLALEFEFLREKLKQAATLLMREDCKTEVAFILGCLHSICHQHCAEYHLKNKAEKHVDS